MGIVNKSAYVIISPIRDEEKYIEKTISSIISQTILPAEWVIVNDGSKDNTEEIIRQAAHNYEWIKVINKKDRGFTEVGRGVVESFYEGLKNLVIKDWDYLVKLDGDISVENNFFETLLKRFYDNDMLGIAGSTCYVLENGILKEEKMPVFHPTAAARMYRRRCYDDIGGIPQTLGWDTIDLVRAQINGWTTERFTDLKIVHFRKMASRNGLWEGKIRTGRNFYITGYHPLFLIFRSIYRITERPFFIESLGVIYGYLKAMFKQLPLVVTQEEKKFLRHQQLCRLFGFKNIFARRVVICGVTISNLTMKSAIRAIDKLIQERAPSAIFTPNIDHIVKLQDDREFKKAYNEASIVVADGMPVVWASAFFGTPLMERIAGSDLFFELCAHSAKREYRLFFLGGRPGSVEMAAEALRKKYPSIKIEGTYSPPLGFENDKDENKKIVDMIKTAEPDILFVGLGAPKQEKWIYRYKDEYRVPVSVGVGGTFEFFSGMVKRAPKWMRRAGLEWFWRLMVEPRRLWKRYLVDDMKFFWLALKEKLKK